MRTTSAMRVRSRHQLVDALGQLFEEAFFAWHIKALAEVALHGSFHNACHFFFHRDFCGAVFPFQSDTQSCGRAR